MPQTNTFDPEKFRRNFKELDDSVFLKALEWAALTGQTVQAVYIDRSRGLLPAPAIGRHGKVRWTVKQYKDWTAGLSKMESEAYQGRPRMSHQLPAGGA